MAAAKYLQTSFLGGEWSKTMQGRSDRADYRSAMNLCRNAVPVEEGAVVRRPGTRQAGITRNGEAGKLVQFHFSQAHPYLLELTNEHARLYNGLGIATSNTKTVSSVSSTTPAVITTSTSHGYATGDQVVFRLIGDPDGSFGTVAPLLQKQFEITVTGATTYTIEDVILGPVDGSTIDKGSAVIRSYQIVEFDTPYESGTWATVRSAQDEESLLLFNRLYETQVLTALTEESGEIFATFSLAEAIFHDGPYLDPPEDGSYLTPSSTSGTITLTETGSFYTFVSTDVGRMVRLFSEPAAWESATAYAAGDAVKYDDAYWTALKATTGGIPGVDIEAWAIDPTAAHWTWGLITDVNSGTSIDLALATADPNGVRSGGNLLYLEPIKVWRMGVYSETTGYPTTGCFHEGRLWIGGEVGNRFDASMSNKTFDFDPTLADGTVADNNGISYPIRSDGVNRPLWMTSNALGVIIGTQAGEWLVRASQLNDPITPTSIQAHRPTKFGSQDVEVLPLPMATAFVQRAGTKLIELTETYPPKYLVGQQLSLQAKHMTAPTILEVAYQAETTPIIWARTGDGELIGCTYRRDSQFSNQPVTFSGWHKHALGTGRTVTSIQSGPSVGGDSDTLSLITYDVGKGIHYVELLTPIFGEEESLLNAWQLDGLANPSGADVMTVDDVTFVRLYGLEYVSGQYVTAFIAGLDLGDYLVPDSGIVDVPFVTSNPLFTQDYLASVTGGEFAYSTTLYGTGTPFSLADEEYYDGALPYQLQFHDEPLGFGLGHDPAAQILWWFAGLQPDEPASGLRTNSTGAEIWTGVHSISNGATYDAYNYGNFRLIAKNTADGTVSVIDPYDAANVVPAGVGHTGAKRLVEAEHGGGHALLADPRTGDVWAITNNANPGFYNNLYVFRDVDNFKQTISPYHPTPDRALYSVGTTTDWVITASSDNSIDHKFRLTNRVRSAAQIAADNLDPAISYDFPDPSLGVGLGLEVQKDSMCFSTQGKLYRFTLWTGTDSSLYQTRLYKFTPPNLALAGGAWTEITPWTPGMGPDSVGVVDLDGNYQNEEYPPTMIQIPGSGGETEYLAILSRRVPDFHTPSGGDLEDFTVSCTYVNTTSETMEHHADFITAYMDENWAPTTAGNAAFRVRHLWETESHREHHAYDFDGDDTAATRYFWAVVNPVSGGSVSSETAAVLVKYHFAAGAAPEVVAIYTEDRWSAYEGTLGENPVATASPVEVTNLTQYLDGSGIPAFDRDNLRFYFPGKFPSAGLLDPSLIRVTGSGETVYPPFSVQVASASGGGAGTVSYVVPVCVGLTFTTNCQIVRPVAPNEAGTNLGPAIGNTRRSHAFTALLHQTGPINFGTEFANTRPAEFRTGGGTRYTALQLFSGTYEGTLEDDYSYDSMICWTVTRPFPACVLAVGAMLKGQDR